MQNFLKNNWFKILAIAFLLGALANNPYSYYQLLRWIVAIIAIYTAYIVYSNQKIGWAWTFGIIAVLFNPIFPFYLSKNSWQTIDVITAIIFFISLSNNKKNEESN